MDPTAHLSPGTGIDLHGEPLERRIAVTPTPSAEQHAAIVAAFAERERVALAHMRAQARPWQAAALAEGTATAGDAR